MTTSLRHYLLVEHVAGAAVINAVLNALIAWLSFRHMTDIPMWGTQSIGGDLIGTTMILPLLTCSIVTRIVRWHLRSGRIASSELGSASGSILEKLPEGLLARGLTLGALTTLIAAPVILVLLGAAGVESLGLRDFVLFKAAYAAVLAAIVQPVIAMRAMLEGAPAAVDLSPSLAS
jgi:hypothetical protein